MEKLTYREIESRLKEALAPHRCKVVPFDRGRKIRLAVFDMSDNKLVDDQKISLPDVRDPNILQTVIASTRDQIERKLQSLAEEASLCALIPETREWNEGRGISAEDWIGCVGTYQLAIGYGLIFWPRFVRFDGYVLREGFSEESLRGFERATEGNRTAVEAVMNHIHIADIHQNVSEYDEAQLRYLGRLLRDIHEVKLKHDFPDLRFEVSFNDEPDLYPTDYEFTFWQVRGASFLSTVKRASRWLALHR